MGLSLFVLTMGQKSLEQIVIAKQQRRVRESSGVLWTLV